MLRNITRKLLITSFQHTTNADKTTFSASISPIKQASVLIPIIDTNPLMVLFTERTMHLKHHAGQISFPGGQMEVDDISLEQTCLRETKEEIGLNADQINIIGQLKPIISNSSFSVTPFIGLVDPKYKTAIDQNEVAALFTVPLDFLIAPKNQRYTDYLYQGTRKKIWVIQYQNYKIWGLTAEIIIEFCQLLNNERF